MNKPQLALASSGIILLVILYFFGQTVPPKTKAEKFTDESSVPEKKIEIKDILSASESTLRPDQLSYLNRLKNSVVRGDVKQQQISAYLELASFWKDSVRNGFLPYAYYNAEIAKLENSEKNLTFAAQLFLENLRVVDDKPLKSWMANQSKELFQRALKINPYNDSSKVGLGACYIFGSDANNPQEVMQGIQQILEVSRRDSTNIYAQFMLGLGGAVSGQFDKAIQRLTKVVAKQPGNIEAILKLAELNEQTGNKQEAIKWYEDGKKYIADPEVIKAIDQQIRALQ